MSKATKVLIVILSLIVLWSMQVVFFAWPIAKQNMKAREAEASRTIDHYQELASHVEVLHREILAYYGVKSCDELINKRIIESEKHKQAVIKSIGF